MNIITPTFNQLWSDKKFLEKRLCEQFEYKNSVIEREVRGEITSERSFELWSSAFNIEERIINRLKELNSGVA